MGFGVIHNTGINSVLFLIFLFFCFFWIFHFFEGGTRKKRKERKKEVRVYNLQACGTFQSRLWGREVGGTGRSCNRMWSSDDDHLHPDDYTLCSHADPLPVQGNDPDC